MIHLLIPLLLTITGSHAETGPQGPSQPAEGPGGQAYVCEDIRFSDFARKAEGYWLFEPQQTPTDCAPVIAFHHGYGAINPMIYGAWIKHLVRQGYIVVYPRYQKNLLFPGSKAFVGNATSAIQAALERLQTEEGRVKPDTSAFFLAGHSYGGAIAAHLAARYRALGLPHPKGALLCAPGTGPLKGGLLADYSGMDPATRLGVIVSVNDYVVGEELGRKVYQTAVHTPHRFLIRQHPDEHGSPALSAGHNECYALDPQLDGGINNLSLRRAKSVAQENAADYYAYWKFLDAIIACEVSGQHCETAKACGPTASYMGQWSDGMPVQPLEVWRP
ncbi:MAG: alpha/beta hydrolase fold domain-containing protein [Bacteroidetes bacterium]|jgi:pimeloyl-ACP methyl ester carboxylesterase|nr:alpha/beta hydrolase fold domain-containing protein [Bacteroidota bacterium]